MTPVKKKTVAAIFIAVALLALIITAAAVIYNLPTKTEGSFERKIINRIDFKITNTNFTFSKTDSDHVFVMNLQLSAKKTEADFYALIDSIEIKDFTIESITVTPNENSPIKDIPPSVSLPVVNGEPAELIYDIAIYFKQTKTGTYNPKLIVNYASGVRKEFIQEYVLKTDLTVTIK